MKLKRRKEVRPFTVIKTFNKKDYYPVPTHVYCSPKALYEVGLVKSAILQAIYATQDPELEGYENLSYAGDQYFAREFHIHEEEIAKNIRQLRKEKYITIFRNDLGQRFLQITDKAYSILY